MENNDVRTVLLVEDQSEQPSSVRVMLEQVASGTFQVVHVGSIGAAEEHLARHPVEVVLLDLGMSGSNGFRGFPHDPANSPTHSDCVALQLG